MNTTKELETTENGYVCTECHGIIPLDSDAVVAMDAAIDRIEATGDPQAVTYQYAGIYHPECFSEAD